MLHLIRATLVRGALGALTPARPASLLLLSLGLLARPSVYALTPIEVVLVLSNRRHLVLSPKSQQLAVNDTIRGSPHHLSANPSLQRSTANSQDPSRFRNRVSLHVLDGALRHLSSTKLYPPGHSPNVPQPSKDSTSISARPKDLRRLASVRDMDSAWPMVYVSICEVCRGTT